MPNLNLYNSVDILGHQPWTDIVLICFQSAETVKSCTVRRFDSICRSVGIAIEGSGENFWNEQMPEVWSNSCISCVEKLSLLEEAFSLRRLHFVRGTSWELLFTSFVMHDWSNRFLLLAKELLTYLWGVQAFPQCNTVKSRLLCEASTVYVYRLWSVRLQPQLSYNMEFHSYLYQKLFVPI